MIRTPRSVVFAVLTVFVSACAAPLPPPARAPMASGTDVRPREEPVLAQPDPVREAVVRTAVAQVGKPYRYGAAGQGGFDCSGLVIYSYAEAGRPNLPHNSDQLSKASTPIRLAQLQPGDLLFFDTKGMKKTSHVAIYIGSGHFVHAPSHGKRVEVISIDHVYWGPHIQSAGRLL